MLLIFLDTETSGLNPDKHRLLELAYRIYDTASGHFILSYETYFSQPPHVWALADSSSLEINGLTYEKLLSGKSEKVISSEITSDFNKVELGQKTGVFVCQNPSFDRIFFNQIISVDIQSHFKWPYHWLDLASMYLTFRILRNGHPLRDMREEDLSKDKIADYFSLPPEKAPHGAMNGVNHLIACYEAMFGKL